MINAINDLIGIYTKTTFMDTSSDNLETDGWINNV